MASAPIDPITAWILYERTDMTEDWDDFYNRLAGIVDVEAPEQWEIQPDAFKRLEDALLEERQFKFRGKTILSQQDIENILWPEDVNDKVVNGFMAMAAVEMGPGAYIFDSLFFPEDKDMTYWAKQVSLKLTSTNSTEKGTLASVKKILLPLCWDFHWTQWSSGSKIERTRTMTLSQALPQAPNKLHESRSSLTMS
jgi:hypothetical protein